MNLNIYLANKNIQLFALGCLFVMWVRNMRIDCPCSKKKKQTYQCYRLEYWGVQANHIYTFAFLGFFFPEYFYVIQTTGILWELFEYYVHKNNNVLKDIGGCLDPPSKKSRYYKGSLIVKGREKEYNIIDRLFNIKNSTQHGWHHSVAEVVVNIISFLVGSHLKKHITIQLFITCLILFIILVE